MNTLIQIGFALTKFLNSKFTFLSYLEEYLRQFQTKLIDLYICNTNSVPIPQFKLKRKTTYLYNTSICQESHSLSLLREIESLLHCQLTSFNIYTVFLVNTVSDTIFLINILKIFLVNTVWCRYLNINQKHIVIMFQVFDPDNSGSVVPTELLVAFSMSMKGSVTDKLR